VAQLGPGHLAAMKLKRIVKVGGLSIVSIVCGLFLWVAVGNFLFSRTGNTEYSFTPKKWGLSVGEEWIMMNTNGQRMGTIKKSKIGPILIERYRNE
jgi:hypothetical protein